MKAWLLAWGLSTALAAAVPVPAAPTRWVTDEAGLLSAQARAALDARLEAYQKGSGHQVLVWVGRTTGGEPIEDFAVRAFGAWKVGNKGLDDGLALFVMAQDRAVRIEVGYGLEQTVPDAVCSRILRDEVLPRLRAGQPDQAVTAGIDSLLAALGGTQAQATGATQAPGPSPAQWVVTGLAVLAFGILFITNPRLALSLLFLLGTGRRRGGLGGFSGGGGFRGGGGRSGGGGASGSW